MRKLAERSQTAAQRSAQLSETVEVAQQAGEMLGSLVPDIQQDSDARRRDQRRLPRAGHGREQINQAHPAARQGDPAEAPRPEQLSATSEELAAQAEKLQESISFFRVGAAAGGSQESESAPVKRTTARAAKIRHEPRGLQSAGPSVAAASAKNGISIDLGQEQGDQGDGVAWY